MDVIQHCYGRTRFGTITRYYIDKHDFIMYMYLMDTIWCCYIQGRHDVTLKYKCYQVGMQFHSMHMLAEQTMSKKEINVCCGRTILKLCVVDRHISMVLLLWRDMIQLLILTFLLRTIRPFKLVNASWALNKTELSPDFFSLSITTLH